MDKSKYRTGHQGIAAYFLLEGAQLIQVAKDEQLGRIYFLFDMPVNIGRTQAKAFFDGQVQVNANDFYTKLTELRTKVYEVRTRT